jgi:adenylate cyclase
MARGLAERERLRYAFGAFVDPKFTERVLREGTDLAGEDVEVSLLFTDVRGFTAYAETAAAREVVSRLNPRRSCGRHRCQCPHSDPYYQD